MRTKWSTPTLITLKINRHEYAITERDRFLDNGACVQLITQKGPFGEWHYSTPVLSKNAMALLKKQFLLIDHEYPIKFGVPCRLFSIAPLPAPKATPNEIHALCAIFDSEFHDGANPIGNWVWTNCVSDTFGGTKSFSGTASQLQQKGWAEFDGKGRDAVCCITQAGYDILQQYKALK